MTKVEELLLNEPNNEEYADIYNSLTEVRSRLTLCKRQSILWHAFATTFKSRADLNLPVCFHMRHAALTVLQACLGTFSKQYTLIAQMLALDPPCAGRLSSIKESCDFKLAQLHLKLASLHV